MNKETLYSLMHPDREFSPMPFWFWNDALDEAELRRQIREMNEKGVNGFVIHPRIGIPREIPYMSEKYLRDVTCAVKEADLLGMKVLLYDEGMYPSGSAHGMVVANNPEFASRGIRCEESTEEKPQLEAEETLFLTLTGKKTSGDAWDMDSIRVYQGGGLKEGYVFLHLIEGFSHGHIRGIHEGEDDWEEPPRSADILRPEAVDSFIRLTHEKYFEALSDYFGNTVMGIFTDEPSVLGRGEDPRMKPWTQGFSEDLQRVGITPPDMTAMWYDIGEETGSIRKKYAEAVAQRLSDSFYKKLYDWCEAHSIALSGHPGKSWDIGLLRYFHIPGQDLVFRRVAPEEGKALSGADTVQAKCSSDAARHRGRRRNMNECFACGGKNGVEWAFNADDMKWTMDWLFVRGVNLLVPHAFFYSLRGERQFGERPPDVGMNNIWWKHYGAFSDYIKRMSYMMTDSVNTAAVAVLCRGNEMPSEIVRPLYENQIEFNYLEESLLKDGSCRMDDGRLQIAAQSYDTMLIGDISLIGREVEAFAKEGGRVIVYNPSGSAIGEAMISVSSYEQTLEYLTKDPVITPACKDLRVSHIVKNGEHFYVLVNEGEQPIRGALSFPADGAVSAFDPWEGKELSLADGTLSLDRRASLILCAGKHPSRQTVIRLDERYGAPRRVIEPEQWYAGGEPVALGSWTEQESHRDFCGTVCYESEFEMDAKDAKRLILDMGAVGEQAEVSLNGEAVGYRLWAPYVMDVTEYVKEGKNRLSIAVTNSLANHYTETRLPSGLLDRVTVKVY